MNNLKEDIIGVLTKCANGIKWYREYCPDSQSPVDLEMLEEIDSLIEKLSEVSEVCSHCDYDIRVYKGDKCEYCYYQYQDHLSNRG